MLKISGFIKHMHSSLCKTTSCIDGYDELGRKVEAVSEPGGHTCSPLTASEPAVVQCGVGLFKQRSDRNGPEVSGACENIQLFVDICKTWKHFTRH